MKNLTGGKPDALACELLGGEIRFYATFLFIFAVISTIINLFIIVIIYRNPELRTPTLFLFAVHAVIDLFAACIVTPIKVSISWRHNWTWFNTFAFMYVVVVIFSFSNIMVICVDRFFHVYHLHKYKITITHLCGSLFLCWLPPTALVSFVGEDFTLCHFIFCILAMIFVNHATLLRLRRYESEAVFALRGEELVRQRNAVHTTLMLAIVFTALNIFPMVSIVLGYLGTFYPNLCAISYFSLLLNTIACPVLFCLRVPCLKRHIPRLFCRKNAGSDRNSIVTSTVGSGMTTQDLPIATIAKKDDAYIEETNVDKRQNDEITSNKTNNTPERIENGEKVPEDIVDHKVQSSNISPPEKEHSYLTYI